MEADYEIISYVVVLIVDCDDTVLNFYMTVRLP